MSNYLLLLHEVVQLKPCYFT